MILEVHEGGGVAFLTSEEVFIYPQHPWTGAVRHLRDPLLAVALIPALDRCPADVVGPGDLALSHSAIVRFKHLEPKRFRGSEARPDALEAMVEVSPALGAMVLGRPQVQRHHLVALAGVLQRAPPGRLDLHILVLAVDARGTCGGSGIDLDRLVSLNPLDLQIRYA